MAGVVNVPEVAKKFVTLGWTGFSAADVGPALVTASIPAASFSAYLDALIATPSNTNDQAIAGCTAADATKITGYLKTKGLVIS